MNGNQGFILAATLWILAGLAALAAYIDSVASTNLEQAIQIKRSVETDLDRHSTEATLLYLLATNRMGYRGLVVEEQQRFADFFSAELPITGDVEIWLNGTPYQGLGGWRFSLQDEESLISVNQPEVGAFQALLRWSGLSAAQSAMLAARTLDYIDTDQLLTPAGAERQAYLRQGLPPPANWTLAAIPEIKRVLGFEQLVTPKQWQTLLPLLTIRPIGGYNFNLMPPQVVAALLDVDARATEALVAERREVPIWRLPQLNALTGTVLNFEDEDFGRLPSRFLRLHLWHPERGERLVVGIALTPYAEHEPWRKDYQYWEPVVEHDPTLPAKAATALL